LFVFTEELIHKSFSAYGCIQEIRVFKEKGYAFIRWVLSHQPVPEAFRTSISQEEFRGYGLEGGSGVHSFFDDW